MIEGRLAAAQEPGLAAEVNYRRFGLQKGLKQIKDVFAESAVSLQSLGIDSFITRVGEVAESPPGKQGNQVGAVPEDRLAARLGHFLLVFFRLVDVITVGRGVGGRVDRDHPARPGLRNPVVVNGVGIEGGDRAAIPAHIPVGGDEVQRGV